MKHFAINHPLGFVIDANFDETKAIQAGTLTREIGNGHRWYGLPTIKQGVTEIDVSLCYYATKLIHIHFTAQGDEFGTSWDDFSEEKERKRARKTEQWLTSINLKPGTYGWGTVWCGYDLKASFSYAALWLFENQRRFVGVELSMSELATLRQLLINVLGNWKPGDAKALGFNQSTCDSVYQGFPETKDPAKSLKVVRTILSSVVVNDDELAKRWLDNNIHMSRRDLKKLLSKIDTEQKVDLIQQASTSP
jgi:hypothetical protein